MQSRNIIDVGSPVAVQYVALPNLGTGYTTAFYRGLKTYELKNHLGNVHALVTDKKAQSSLDHLTVSSYTADIIWGRDYYVFGWVRPLRWYNTTRGKSRYTFNGKESDDDVSGEGNQLDYGMRIYDPRLGRFLSVDPITEQYPFYTPYQYAGNSPIKFVDIDGLEPGTPATLPRPALQPTRGGSMYPIRGGNYPNSARLFEDAPRWDQRYVADNNGFFVYQKTVFEQNTSTEADQKYKQLYYFKNYIKPKLEVIKLTESLQKNAIAEHPSAQYNPFSFNQQLRVDKALAREDDLMSQVGRKTPAEVYHLTAKQDGWYTCYSCENVQMDNVAYRVNATTNQKEIHLKKGEIWKIGKHNMNGVARYPTNSYEDANFDYQRQGLPMPEAQALIAEKWRLIVYPYHPENTTRAGGNSKQIIPRPAGNKQDN